MNALLHRATNKKLIAVGVLGILFLGACSKQKEAQGSSDSVVAGPPAKAQAEAQAEPNLPQEDIEQVANLIKEHELYRYPTITTLLAVNDAQQSKAKLLAAGASIDYDPNFSEGSQIGFLVASIPPELLQDKDFLRSLKLRAISISSPEIRGASPKVAGGEINRAFDENVFIPIKDIRIPELQKKKSRDTLLGAGTTVAIIDTGIDAGHPVFQDRVIFWDDSTEETQVALSKYVLEGNTLSIAGKKLKIDESLLQSQEVYVGMISEEAFGTQNSFDDKASGNTGLDLNLNGSKTDKFAVVVVPNEENLMESMAYVDLNADGLIGLEGNEARPIADFNAKRAHQYPNLANAEVFVDFPARNQSIRYPLLLATKDGKLDHLRLGVVDGSHGTHVAGIVAGNGLNVVGAAPAANLMSLKVCSGITCTTDAILRGILKAFYNDAGIVPDVVNISLGSHQQYNKDVLDYLMQDLASKFGSVFVVSASNSGPGYRSLNSIASFGPTIQVGAHVSTESLKRQYSLDDAVAEKMPFHNLLFFSSVGPSYTGHLRPNVIAPGSALSSTALVDSGLEMYNGTSMSSPIVAGTAAALLSVAKRDARLSGLFEDRDLKVAQMLEAHQGGSISNPSGLSLTGLALSVRSALENSAIALPYYTTAQQGHGLIDALAAYEPLVKLAAKWHSKKAHLFELKLNNNAKGNRLYNRKIDTDKVHAIELSLDADGEISEIDKLLIKETPIQIKLEMVEAHHQDGSIDRIDLRGLNQAEKDTVSGKLLFHVGTRGIEGEKATEATVIMTSRRKTFYSIRHLDRMQEGVTYQALFGLYQNGVRVQSVLDVVHRGVELSDAPQTIVSRSLSPNGKEYKNFAAKLDQHIEANGFHRIPVVVGADISKITVELGIPAGESGALYLQAYSPDGRELQTLSVLRSSEQPSISPVTKMEIDTAGAPGIYEITVSASNWRWMGEATYDLIVSGSKLKVSTDAIQMKSGARHILTLQNPDEGFGKLSVDSLDLMAMKQAKLPVVAGRWTYHRVEISAATEALDVFIPDNKETADLNFFGRIDNHLYVGVEEGVPTAVATANSLVSGSSYSRFDDLSLVGEYAWIAVETFSVVGEDGSLDSAAQSLPVDIVFEGDKVGQINPVVQLGGDAGKIVSILLEAPESLVQDAYGWLYIEKLGTGIDVRVKAAE